MTSGYPFHSAYPNRLCGWFGRFDHRVVGCGRRAHGLLHETEEELAATFRPPAIEAKSEFIQVVLQMPRCHCALVRTQYPPLQERGNSMHARHQLRCLLPAAPQSRNLPLVALGLQTRVALPAVGVNGTAGSMQSFTKECRLTAEASSITRIRIRPVPSPSAWAAITTKALLSVCRPATPSSNPPTIVSSTSTHPLSRSRSGRIIARLNLCSQVQAVS
jgi:hypothetical protein